MSNPSKKLILNSLSAAVMLACSSQAAQAYNANDSITNALKFGQEDAKYGKFKVNLRYRYEWAHTRDTPTKDTRDAYANTLRLRLGYLTPIFSGFQGFVEYEGNLAMQQDYLSPKGNWRGDVTRDVIADPQSSELNRFWVSYKGFGSEIKGGRQRIILDDSRFIGNVGWRQMEQTYDAITFTNKSIDNMTFKAGYIGQVQDIFSRNIDLDVVFLNLNYKVNKHATVSGYTYLVSYENAAAASTKTFGLKVNGSPKINQDLKLHYTAEYSNQSQYVNNPADYNVDRYNLMVGATFKGITFKTGMGMVVRNAKAINLPVCRHCNFAPCRVVKVWRLKTQWRQFQFFYPIKFPLAIEKLVVTLLPGRSRQEIMLGLHWKKEAACGLFVNPEYLWVAPIRQRLRPTCRRNKTTQDKNGGV